VFDSPQWSLVPDLTGARFYANVDNRLEITNGRTSFHVALAVPTQLFTYMLNIGVKQEDTVQLALDWIEGYPVFSMVISGENLHDLWVFPRNGEPDWIYDLKYRVR
jgi:hypothetical protein